MSPRRIAFLLVAVVAAVAMMVLTRFYLASQRPAPVEPAPVVVQPEKPATMILVARGDLKVGQFVRPEMLRWETWPDDDVPPNYLAKTQHPQVEEFSGWVVRSAIGDGEPITLTRIIAPREGGFLAAVLKPGYRAVTVNVSASSGVSGLIFPDDRVDLIATLNLVDDTSKEKPEHKVSETVLTNLRVLALDQRLDPQGLSGKEAKDAQVAKTATLEVTPKQAEIIAVVTEVARLSLALRALPKEGGEEEEVAANDGEPSHTFDSEATKLIRPPGVEAANTQKMYVYRGTTVTEIDITGRPAPGGKNPPPKANDDDH
jgi:pilus assembly protein CpaB